MPRCRARVCVYHGACAPVVALSLQNYYFASLPFERNQTEMAGRQPEDLTVLVVEDYDDMSLAMRLALERKGYHILEASDGAQAVEVAARERPDVILMDLSLPVLDGLAATERIRANTDLRDT